MIELEKLSLQERVDVYANGRNHGEIPPHSFDLSWQDSQWIISCISLVEMLAKIDYPSNFQRERHDLAEYCYKTTSLLRIAKEIAGHMKGETNNDTERTIG